jgi:hypothetical protein
MQLLAELAEPEVEIERTMVDEMSVLTRYHRKSLGRAGACYCRLPLSECSAQERRAHNLLKEEKIIER